MVERGGAVRNIARPKHQLTPPPPCPSQLHSPSPATQKHNTTHHIGMKGPATIKGPKRSGGGRRRSRGVKRRRGKPPAKALPLPPPDPNAPDPNTITLSTVINILYPIWAHCLLTEGIERDIEQRKGWKEEWGEEQWMIVLAGAKRPTRKDIDYIEKNTDKPTGLTIGAALKRSCITGMVLYERPSPNKRGGWDRIGGDKYGEQTWKVKRALRFQQPIRDCVWGIEGPPKALKSYKRAGEVEGLVEKIRNKIKYQFYWWVQ